MRLVHSIDEVRTDVRQARNDGKTIGLVPTLGALHEGHLSLVRGAREQCGFVAVSIFVNPTQFRPGEDFDRYPRALRSDAKKCHDSGVDLIFAPSADEMYPADFDSWVDVGGLTDVLEGKLRPGHFRGVATVCAKLFNIFDPDHAYFGKKDYQQLKVIQKMVRDLSMRVQIVPCDTIRDPDGLAMSSRNAYLSADERAAALVLNKSLQEAEKAYNSGECQAPAIQVVVEHLIKAEPTAQIDYIAVVDAETLAPIDEIDRPAVVLLAVTIGSTRLIDNTLLG